MGEKKTGMALRWEGVGAVVGGKGVLRGGGGVCAPGEIMAIMGPSGESPDCKNNYNSVYYGIKNITKTLITKKNSFTFI